MCNLCFYSPFFSGTWCLPRQWSLSIGLVKRIRRRQKTQSCLTNSFFPNLVQSIRSSTAPAASSFVASLSECSPAIESLLTTTAGVATGEWAVMGPPFPAPLRCTLATERPGWGWIEAAAAEEEGQWLPFELTAAVPSCTTLPFRIWPPRESVEEGVWLHPPLCLAHDVKVTFSRPHTPSLAATSPRVGRRTGPFWGHLPPLAADWRRQLLPQLQPPMKT